jgi:hypothetical protein
VEGPPVALVAEATDDAGEGKGSGAEGDGGGDGTHAPPPNAGEVPAAENAPAATQDGTAEVEELEKLTPEGTVLLTVPFIVPQNALRLIRSIRASARGAPASSPDVPSLTPELCVPDAYDHLVYVTHPSRSPLLTDSYDTG